MTRVRLALLVKPMLFQIINKVHSFGFYNLELVIYILVYIYIIIG